MVYKIKPLLVPALFGLMLMSCKSSQQVRDKLSYKPTRLNYLIESPRHVEKTATRLFVEVKPDTACLATLDSIKRTSWMVVPTVVFNYFRVKRDIHFQKGGLEGHPTEVAETSFLEQARRFSTFQITPHRDSAHYTLTLSINQLDAVINDEYLNQSSFLAFWGPNVFAFLFIWSNSFDYQGEAHSRFTATLRDARGQLAFQKEYRSLIAIPFIEDTDLLGHYDFRYQFRNAALWEGLGQSFKQNFEAIISDLNDFREDQEAGFNLRDLSR